MLPRKGPIYHERSNLKLDSKSATAKLFRLNAALDRAGACYLSNYLTKHYFRNTDQDLRIIS